MKKSSANAAATELPDAPTTLEMISGKPPRNLLILSPQAAALAAHSRQRFPDCAITAIEAQEAGGQLADQGRYELIVVHRQLERLSPAEGLQLLARLRDLHTAGSLLVTLDRDVAAGKHCQAGDLMAMGLHRNSSADSDPQTQHFVYSLRNYKLTPDWLNARFWANPEQWEKHRW